MDGRDVNRLFDEGGDGHGQVAPLVSGDVAFKFSSTAAQDFSI